MGNQRYQNGPAWYEKLLVALAVVALIICLLAVVAFMGVG
jgi:hypothetical protein